MLRICVQMRQYKGQACYCVDRIVTTLYASYACTRGPGFKFSANKYPTSCNFTLLT